MSDSYRFVASAFLFVMLLVISMTPGDDAPSWLRRLRVPFGIAAVTFALAAIWWPS